MKRQDVPSQAMAELRNRHLEFYLDLMSRAEQEAEDQQGDWAEVLEAELDNLRAALGWAIESGQAAKALDLAGTISPFWGWWGRYGEGRHWLERALAADGENPAPRAKALSALAEIAHMQGDDSTSSDRYREAANAYQEMGDDLGVATALSYLGWNLWYLERSAEAIPILEKAIPTLRGFQATRLLARAMSGLAWSHVSQGNPDEAVRLHEEAIQILRDAGDRGYLADRLLSQANIHLHMGDFIAAVRVSREMIALLRELGDKWGLLIRLQWAASNVLTAGNRAEAESLHEEQLLLAVELGSSTGTSNARSGLARIARARGDFESARSLYIDAIAKGYEVGDPSYIELGYRADHLGELGELLLSLGRRDEAKRRLLEAVAISRNSRNSRNPLFKHRLHRALRRLASIAEEEGNLERAILLKEEAIEIFSGAEDAVTDIHVKLDESEILSAKGDDSAALAVLERALQTARDVGRNWLLARVHQSIGRLLHERGEDRDAAARLEEGMDAVSELGAHEDASRYLELLAAAAAAAGDPDRAFEVLRQLGWRRNLLGPAPRIAETLAKIKAGREEWQAAARLIGAAEALRSEISRSMPEWEREAHEPYVFKVREALGPVAFEGAVDQGRESGVAREIEEALA